MYREYNKSKVQVELTGFQEGLMIVAGGGVGGGFHLYLHSLPILNQLLTTL